MQLLNSKRFLIILASALLIVAVNFIQYVHNHNEKSEKLCPESAEIKDVKPITELSIQQGDAEIDSTVRPLSTQEHMQEKSSPYVAVDDRTQIKLHVSDELRNDPMYQVYLRRKQFTTHACQFSRAVFDKTKTFEQKRELQRRINSKEATSDEEECVPLLTREGLPDNHYYDDDKKFHGCMPTKTGSSNWLKTFFALTQKNGEVDPSNPDLGNFMSVLNMPRFRHDLDEFIRGRTGLQGYFSMVTVRHPLARLYSAWKDKFRNAHPWYTYIHKKYGAMYLLLEQKNMTAEPFEVSFEAFLHLASLQRYDVERDRHWKTAQTYCSTCNIEYDFIVKQETAMQDNEYLMKVLGAKFNVPGRYDDKVDKDYKPPEKVTMDDIAKPYKGVPKRIIEQLYLNYYADFVFYNYSIDEVLDVAGEDTREFKIAEKTYPAVQELLYKKYGYYTLRSDDTTCKDDDVYPCKYGKWRKLDGMTLSKKAPGWGAKTFTVLDNAMKFACDKDDIKGIYLDDGKYILQGGNEPLKRTTANHTVWVKQYTSVVIM